MFFKTNEWPVRQLASLCLLYGLLVFWPFRSCPCVDILVSLLDRNPIVIVEKKYGSISLFYHFIIFTDIFFFFPFFLFKKN